MSRQQSFSKTACGVFLYSVNMCVSFTKQLSSARSNFEVGQEWSPGDAYLVQLYISLFSQSILHVIATLQLQRSLGNAPLLSMLLSSLDACLSPDETP